MLKHSSLVWLMYFLAIIGNITCMSSVISIINSKYSWQCLFHFSSPFFYLEGSESITRETVVSGHTSISSTVPLATFSEEEKKVSVIKAPHYEGIGPIDESGIPIAIRTVSSCWTHRHKEPSDLLETSSDRERSSAQKCPFLSCWYVIRLWRGDNFQLSAAFDPVLKAPRSNAHYLSLSLLLSLPGLVIKRSSKRSLLNTVWSLVLCSKVCFFCVISVQTFPVITQSSVSWWAAYKTVHVNHRQWLRRGRERVKVKRQRAGKKKTDCALSWADKHFCGHFIW